MGIDKAVPMNQIAERRGSRTAGKVALQPAPESSLEVQRPFYHQPRCCKRGVLGVNKTQMNLAFVMKRSLGHAGIPLLEHIHRGAAQRQFQRNAGTLQTAADNSHTQTSFLPKWVSQ